MHQLDLAGGLAGQPDEPAEAAGFELAERELEHATGLAVAGGGLEEEDRGQRTENRGQIGLNRFLTGAQGREGGVEDQGASAGGGAELLVQELDEGVELVEDQRLVEGREREGLGQAGTGLDEDELRVGAEGREPRAVIATSGTRAGPTV